MTTHTASNAMKMCLQITAMNVEKLLALIPRYEILKKISRKKTFIFSRICPTRRSIGTRLASSATSAGPAWWTSSLDPKLTESTVVLATMPSLQQGVMAAGMYSKQVWQSRYSS